MSKGRGKISYTSFSLSTKNALDILFCVSSCAWGMPHSWMLLQRCDIKAGFLCTAKAKDVLLTAVERCCPGKGS